MLTKGAIEDLIAQHLFRRASGEVSSVSRKVPELKPRVFISEFELRGKMTAGSRSVTVPRNAIISPLALDWLDYDGIEIIRL